jgi:hypothetical protein
MLRFGESNTWHKCPQGFQRTASHDSPVNQTLVFYSYNSIQTIEYKKVPEDPFVGQEVSSPPTYIAVIYKTNITPNINREKDEVFNILNRLKLWKKW